MDPRASAEALPLGADGRVDVFVELAEPAAADAYADVVALRGGSGPSQAVAVSAARAQIAVNAESQDRLAVELRARGIEHIEQYRVQRVANAIVLRADPSDIPRIAALPDVKRAEIYYPDELHNSVSVPFIGAPSVWDNTAPNLPRGTTGQGIRIGVIDTGIDYQHPTFGGPGTLVAYQANDRVVITDQVGGVALYPTAKVVGGWDFVGDAYNGSSVATPSADPDPTDCNGHGTHVAGTAAGFGVNQDGTQFAGPYDSSTNYRNLRIGPGVAPDAQLYALRVFGCGGSTAFTVQAIEYAVDPNADGDFSDRLDVINMSLGSNFGNPFNASAVASDRAARLGVIVVASAGNAGETVMISGSPGASTRTISVANVTDAAGNNAVRVNSPAGIAAAYLGGAASFGTVAAANGFTGNVVRVNDDSTVAAGGTVNDACEPPATSGPNNNWAGVSGNIALIDRGGCGFKLKAFNAQLGGATAVIIANVASSANPATPPGMADDATVAAVTIPVVSLNLADGDLLRNNLGGLNATILPGGDSPNTSTSRGPRSGSPLPNVRLKPEVAAPGTSIPSAQTGIVCTAPAQGCITANASGFIPSGASLTLSGTSMAAPHIAGVAALVRDLYPSDTVEEVKARIVTRSYRNVTQFPAGLGLRSGPSRVGNGRIDTPAAAASNGFAFSPDEPGLVSVSFDSAVTGPQTRTVIVENRSAAAQVFTLGLDVVNDAPGVSFALPGGTSLAVPASSQVSIQVEMVPVLASMDHFRDPTLPASQTATGAVGTNLGAQPRQFLTEEMAYLTFSQGSTLTMRLPVYAAPYPASAIQMSDVIPTGGAASGSTTLTIGGSGVCTGTPAATECTLDTPADQVSLVTPLELQISSTRNPTLPPYVDIQYAGIAYRADGDELIFGLSTFGPWGTPTLDAAFSFDIDCGTYNATGTDFASDTCTGAPDGSFDLRVFLSDQQSLANLVTASTASRQDVYVATVQVLAAGPRLNQLQVAPTYVNRFAGNVRNTRVYDNEVVAVALPRNRLKIDGAFSWRARSCFGFTPTCAGVDVTPTATWNRSAQGLDFGGLAVAPAVPGATVPATWDTANLSANGSVGALFLHHFNTVGNRAEVAVVEGASVTDIEISIASSTASPFTGVPFTFTVTIENVSQTSASNVEAVISLPPGLTAGAANASQGSFTDGLWTVGSLTSGLTATLELTATASADELMEVVAQSTRSSPVDTNAANNRATVRVFGLRAALFSNGFESNP
jgi:uncharacterized repeat protein (TIGR01451 family)